MYEKICLYCGKTFFAERSDARFCSHSHRTMHGLMLKNVQKKTGSFIAYIDKMLERAETDPELADVLHSRLQHVEQAVTEAGRKCYLIRRRHQAS